MTDKHVIRGRKGRPKAKPKKIETNKGQNRLAAWMQRDSKLFLATLP